MSGNGSNAEKVLDFHKKTSGKWLPSVIITDAPEKSRAAEIAAKYNLPLVELSIREFYRQYGEDKISLGSENGRRIRELWTAALREKIAPLILISVFWQVLCRCPTSPGTFHVLMYIPGI